jgi:hypothetical protein
MSVLWITLFCLVAQAEQQYLAQADRRRSAAARPFASTGMGP